MRKQLISAVLLLVLGACVSAFASVSEYEKAAELNRDNVGARFNLGVAYYKEGMHDKAIETMKQVLEMNRADSETHAKVDYQAAQILGIEFFNYKGDDNEAIKYFTKATELNPAAPDNYYYMGLSYLRKNDLDNAIKELTLAVNKGYEDPGESNFRLGQAYYRKNVFGDAIKYLEKAVSFKPSNLEAREILGLIYHKRKEADKAIEHFREIAKVNPENFNVQYLLGLNYFEKKEYDKMITAYKKAITINPNFADAHYNLGMAYYYRNMYKESIDELEIAKKLNPSDPSTFSLLAQAKTTAYEYYFNQGTTARLEDDLVKAKENFELAIAVKPGDAEAQNKLNEVNSRIKDTLPERLQKARAAYDSGRYGDAYAEWSYAKQVDPSGTEAAEGLKKIEKNLGDLINAKEKSASEFMAQGRYNEAIDEYRALKNIVPKSSVEALDVKISSARSKRDGKVNELLKMADKYATGKDKKIKQDYKKALAKYNEVLVVDKTNEAALNGITKVNQTIESEKQKFLAIAKQNKASNRDKAIANYKKVLQLDPNNEEAGEAIKSMTGEVSKVTVDAQKIKSLYYQGVDRYVNGDIESAIKAWDQVLALDATHAEAKKNITRAREKLAAIKRLSK